MIDSLNLQPTQGTNMQPYIVLSQSNTQLLWHSTTKYTLILMTKKIYPTYLKKFQAVISCLNQIVVFAWTFSFESLKI